MPKNTISRLKNYCYLDLVVPSASPAILYTLPAKTGYWHILVAKINTDPCIGVKTLMEIAGKTPGSYTISDVVFLLGPRINAAGRIDDAKHAVELLIACMKRQCKKA
jgi:single-stranded-DNA-specific exonuclease